MDWFKRASGLKICLAIWLLVLLVPLWRLRAVRQWQGDQTYGPYQVLELGLRPESERELLRLTPNDAAVQLQALSKPNLGRETLPNFHNEELQNASDAYFAKFERLSRRFPRELFIRSQWLRDATQGELVIESDALVATYNLQGQHQPRTAWMSVAARQKALQVAQEGATQEPDNAFWRWMEAIFNFSLRRDDAALAALEKAGLCPRFDDGVVEATRRRIALMKRIQTVDFDDQMKEVEGALLPHLAIMRSATREAMWQANRALQRGDTARALQIAAIMQRAATPPARDRSYLISHLVGEALCYVTWQQSIIYAGEKAPQYTGEVDSEERETQRRDVVDQFARYARDGGRPDLATSAQRLQASFTGQQRARSNRDPHYDGLYQAANSLGPLHWLSSWLLWLTVWSAVVWGVSFVLSKWTGAGANHQRKSAAICSAFCVGVTGAVLWAAIRLGGINSYVMFSESLSIGESPQAVTYQRLSIVLLLVWTLPILFLSPLPLVRRARPQFKITRRSGLQILLYLGLVSGFVTWWSAMTAHQLEDTIWGQLWPMPIFLFWVSLLGITLFHVLNKRGGARWITLLFWLAIIVLSAGIELTFGQSEWISYFTGFACVSAALLAIATLLWYLDNWRTNQTIRPLLAEVTGRTRIASATLAVVASLVYFALLLIAMPVHHHAQEVLDRQLIKGEIS